MPALLQVRSPGTGHHWESQTEAAAEAPANAHASSAQHQTLRCIPLDGSIREIHLDQGLHMDGAGMQRRVPLYICCIEVRERWQAQP